jgi:2'-5' RNA ligase
MRLFVAAALDDPARQALAAAARRMESALGCDARAFRFVSAPDLHVTLRFLGAVEEPRVPGFARALEAASADIAPFSLEFRGAGGFPNPRRPRVLWLGLGDGADELGGAATCVEAALIACGCEPETRPFSAHVTVARARDPRRPPSAAGACERVAGLVGEQRVREIVLYRSVPEASSVRYEALATFPLSRPR